MRAKAPMWITIIAGGCITAAVALGGWNLATTASIPKHYATKIEVSEVKRDASEDRDRIRQEIQSGFDDMKIEQRSLKNSIDELNRFLRDKFTHE